MKKLLTLASALLASAALVACGGAPAASSANPSAPATTSATEEKINLTAAKTTLIVGKTTTITSSVAGVTFTSRDETVATVDANGLVTALKAGSTVITARKDGYRDGTITITVSEIVPTESIGKVKYIVEGFEWGPAISGILLELDTPVQASALSVDLFVANTNNQVRDVLAVYLTDENGDVINATSGTYVRFDLRVHYESAMVSYGEWGTWPSANDYGCSPFTYNNMNTWKANLKVELKLAEGKTLTLGAKTYDDELIAIASEIDGRIIPDVKDWGEQKSNTDGTRTLTYKAYETEELKNDGVKNPLIIWLHGQGEGGTDVDIALLGNDVTNLGQDKVQSHFKTGAQQGAYVLAVQTPTMWMDDGSGKNHGGAAHSVYTSLLKDTIDKYVAANTDVDAERLIVGGCSNGGYMTMEMAITYPDYFAAYYPICEAYKDAFVTDDDIAKLKDLSIWFTHSANDTTVNNKNFTTATYKRLMAAGAQDVHYSFFEKVLGDEGRLDGVQNEYQGHYSWIYVLKDECAKDIADPSNVVAPSTKDVLVKGEAVSLWGWAASK